MSIETTSTKYHGRVMISVVLLVSVWFWLLSTAANCSLVPALYAFGDSMFDSGNNNFLPTTVKANFLPYGVNFATGPTGRFTNGRTIVDFLAEYLELPCPPPFISLRKSDIITGLNFASSSCGILPETGSQFVINLETLINRGKCLSLDDQVSLFKTIALNDLAKHFNGSNSLSKYLSKSIFAFSIGSNDYIGNYLDKNTTTNYTPLQFSKLLVGNLSHHLQRLFDSGARKFVVFEIGPIGCIPSIVRNNKHNGLCVEETNMVVHYFNKKLQEMLKKMTLTLPGAIFVLGHVNWLGYDMIMNPAKYGLLDSWNPCCNAWSNGTSGCIPLLSPCSNADKHFFWDGYHETEAVYSLFASRCFNGTSVCIPMNIRDIARI